jgi:hypothetical protein
MQAKSTRDLADWLGVDEWRVRRVFEERLVPEPPRIGRCRAIPVSMVPAVIDALRAKGWLPEVAAHA